METDSILSATALGISLVWFAIISLGVAGISSVSRQRVQQLKSQGLPGSGTLDRLHRTAMGPAGSLTVVRAICFSAALISSVALIITVEGLDWVGVAIVSLAVLIFLGLTDGVSRAVASTHGEQIALRFSILALVLAWLLKPLLAAQVRLIGQAARTRLDEESPGPEIILHEGVLQLDPDAEPLDEHEARMIRGVVRLDKTVAREIMVPRVDLVAAEVGISVAELAQQMTAGGHSRIPVYVSDLDHIEGIAYARDVLRLMVDTEDSATSRNLREVIRPALFIPESKTLEELLDEFQRRRVHMAVVVDEYGGVSGIVTIEDLLEEIVGEIQDEFDVGEPEIIPVTEGEYIMDARVSIDQLNELLNVYVEGDGFDTLGGFVYQRLGKIPSAGDGVDYYDGLRVEVVSTVGRRLKRLKVTKTSERDSGA